MDGTTYVAWIVKGQAGAWLSGPHVHEELAHQAVRRFTGGGPVSVEMVDDEDIRRHRHAVRASFA